MSTKYNHIPFPSPLPKKIMEFGKVTFSDEEMESLSRMFSNVEEESNRSVPHCVGLGSFLPFDESNLSIFAPLVEEGLFYSPSINVTYGCHSNHFSQEEGCGADATFLLMQSYDQNCFFSADSNPNPNPNHNQYLKSTDYYSMTYPNGNALLEPVFSDVDDMHERNGGIEKVGIANEQEPTDEPTLKTKIDDVKESCPHDSPSPKKEKSNISNKQNAKKRKENTMISRKKKRKMINSGEYSSEEDDSNASRELTGEASSESKDPPQAPTSKIKIRASRGAATDPQSLYARKRRERINERLRVLQNIVPNGTKVDISTMLEEAVHYVKFLQLQIKLLSSDELWMFAPIAYNGMDIGLYQRLAPTINFSVQN